MVAVLGTQALATLIAVYGLFMTPLGWGWALFVWGYALAWFLVNDRVKLLAYRIFDPSHAASAPKDRRCRDGNRRPGACMKSLIIFDLDGALAERKSNLDGEMAALLARLVGIVDVASRRLGTV